MKISRYVVLLALVCLAQTAYALSAIEYMKLDASQQYDVIKPIMVTLLSRGYKKVPSNEFTFMGEIKKLIFEKGYTYQNIEQVAEEAALRVGMTR